MGRIVGFVEQFYKCDQASNDATIEILNNLSPKQQKMAIKMVNNKNKQAFDEMRKRGIIR